MIGFVEWNKKPGSVHAFRYMGPSNYFSRVMDDVKHGGIEPCGVDGEPWEAPEWPLRLLTVQGQWVTCKAGEWIIMENQAGRFYPCSDEEFRARYVTEHRAIPEFSSAFEAKVVDL